MFRFPNELINTSLKSHILFFFNAVNTGSYEYSTSSTPSVTFASGTTLSSTFGVSTISNSIWEGLKILDVSIDPPTNLGFTVKAIDPEVLRVNILDDDCE